MALPPYTGEDLFEKPPSDALSPPVKGDKRQQHHAARGSWLGRAVSTRLRIPSSLASHASTPLKPFSLGPRVTSFQPNLRPSAPCSSSLLPLIQSIFSSQTVRTLPSPALIAIPASSGGLLHFPSPGLCGASQDSALGPSPLPSLSRGTHQLTQPQLSSLFPQIPLCP